MLLFSKRQALVDLIESRLDSPATQARQTLLHSVASILHEAGVLDVDALDRMAHARWHPGVEGPRSQTRAEALRDADLSPDEAAAFDRMRADPERIEVVSRERMPMMTEEQWADKLGITLEQVRAARVGEVMQRLTVVDDPVCAEMVTEITADPDEPADPQYGDVTATVALRGIPATYARLIAREHGLSLDDAAYALAVLGTFAYGGTYEHVSQVRADLAGWAHARKEDRADGR